MLTQEECMDVLKLQHQGCHWSLSLQTTRICARSIAVSAPGVAGDTYLLDRTYFP
jgi:hypothetical protein